MSFEIREATDELQGDIRDFNARLASQDVPYRLPERPESLLGSTGSPVRQRLFLAIAVGKVRGGYLLKSQRFLVSGETVTIGNYQLPLSEGVVDRSWAAVGPAMLLDALRRQPLLYALGLGGDDEAVTRLLRAARWQIASVPFLFSFFTPAAPARLSYVRRSRTLSWFANLAYWSGAAFMGTRIQRLRARAGAEAEPVTVNSFGAEADEIWSSASQRYVMAAVRDSATLAQLYPISDSRFVRLLHRSSDTTVGWSVLLATAMSEHSYFGNLRVGTVVDAFAKTGSERQVIAASLRHLMGVGCDVAITNQSHRAWVHGAKASGMVEGPSNFLLAVSPRLLQRFGPKVSRLGDIHFTRGDGDGPINL